ncbi:MAG: DUF4157 domain-containing protein [Ferruginibacter sp.]
MFSSAEKTNHHTTAIQQKAVGTSFFRKAGEESFFGDKANPSFFNPVIQTKLSVSSPDDPQEKEADAVADRVMRMADPAPVTSNEKKEELHRSEEDTGITYEGETSNQTIQCREEADGEIDRKEEKEDEKVHKKPIANSVAIQAKEDTEEKIHPKLCRKIDRSAALNDPTVEGEEGSMGSDNIDRKAISLYHSDIIQRSGRGPPQDSMQFGQSLASSKGGGSALPDNTRQFMESRFNADFNGVKIHTGSTAETLSNTIHAQAFTHGNDIYFNSSKYSPNTADGGSLLAHELTHTIQQGASNNNTPTQNSNTAVAAKSTLQRQPANPSPPPIKSAATRSKPHDEMPAQIKPPVSGRPKSLRDFRKEVFSIDRKEEPVVEDNPKSANEETSIQPKTEMSHLSVDANGNLHHTSSAPATLPTNILLAREEIKDNKNEDEDRMESSMQPALQKKAWSGLQRTGKIETVTAKTISDTYSVQSQKEYHDSSLNYETDAATSVMSNEKDRGPPEVSLKSKAGEAHIQRSWLGDAWDAVSGFVGEAAEVIARGLDAAKEWILRRIRTFVQNIPGYNILALILQHDPITHEPVERSGRNILLAGLQLIPGGSLFQQVLERVDAINEAGAWIDARMSDLLSMVSSIGNRFTEFMDHLSITDIGNPEAVLDRVAELFRGIFNDVTGFMGRAAVDFLEMIKRIMLRLIVDFVRTRIPRLYPLLCVALGHDPVTGEDVPRNGHTILYATLDATDSGREQRRQMEETGTFDRVAAWIDRGIAVFSTAYVQLRQAFTNLWSYVTIENLFSPIETFTRIYNDFAAPVALVGNFLSDLAMEIVRLIKEALKRRLRDYARTVRGYFLVSVIIGSDPFTGEVVPRTIPNIIHGFMSLMEGGEEQFRQMEESGAIARTTQRIDAAVARLNMTPGSIIQLFIDLWNSFGLQDLAHPIDAFMRIVNTFGEPIGRLIDFVIEIVKIVVHVILEIMNFPFDLINNIITRAMAAFERIKRDPIGFLKNLLRAIKQGFIQFFDHILTHLLNGLTGWLMSELRDANVPAPTDFSLRGIIGWVLQVLGISMEAIWAKLAAHPRIGPQRVARIRGMISSLEGIWTFIKDVQERGVAAIWDKIQEQLTNLWSTVLDAVKNWVMEKIITQVTVYLLGLLDPTGIMAVINSAISIYRAIQSFMRYLRQMLEIVNSFVNGVADIAEGNVATAATYLENTMGRAMPIVIGFLADQVGLGGVGRRIAEIIGRVREMVDRALTWLVNRAVDTGMNLLDRAMGAVRGSVGGGGTPRERLTNALRDGLAIVNRFAGRKIGALVLRPLLGVVKLRYGLTSLDVVPREGRWVVRGEINPIEEITSNAEIEEGPEGGQARTTIQQLFGIANGEIIMPQPKYAGTRLREILSQFEPALLSNDVEQIRGAIRLIRGRDMDYSVFQGAIYAPFIEDQSQAVQQLRAQLPGTEYFLSMERGGAMLGDEIILETQIPNRSIPRQESGDYRAQQLSDLRSSIAQIMQGKENDEITITISETSVSGGSTTNLIGELRRIISSGRYPSLKYKVLVLQQTATGLEETATGTILRKVGKANKIQVVIASTPYILGEDVNYQVARNNDNSTAPIIVFKGTEETLIAYKITPIEGSTARDVIIDLVDGRYRGRLRGIL